MFVFILQLTYPPLPPVRLDQILKFKSDSGVKVFVLLYKESSSSKQSNNSLNAKSILQQLSGSGNISILRHPNKMADGQRWTHRENLIVVDRCVLKCYKYFRFS